MTTRVPFTKAKIKRAITAARELGLRVKGIRPDGTVEVEDTDAPIVPEIGERQADAADTSWDDVR
jgi:hypothetical protein